MQRYLQVTSKVPRFLVYSTQESQRWSSISTRQILMPLQWLFVVKPFGCIGEGLMEVFQYSLPSLVPAAVQSVVQIAAAGSTSTHD